MDKGTKIVYLCRIAEVNMSIEKKWIVMEPGNPALVRQLTQELGIDSVLTNLLVQRGIDTFCESHREFFRPGPFNAPRSLLNEGYG